MLFVEFVWDNCEVLCMVRIANVNCWIYRCSYTCSFSRSECCSCSLETLVVLHYMNQCFYKPVIMLLFCMLHQVRLFLWAAYNCELARADTSVSCKVVCGFPVEEAIEHINCRNATLLFTRFLVVKYSELSVIW